MSRINLTIIIGPSALLTDQYDCSIKVEHRYTLHESYSSLRAAAVDFRPCVGTEFFYPRVEEVKAHACEEGRRRWEGCAVGRC